MWTSKGRGGYGDTNLDGTYDDVILGVSPNGRQYRNEATLETRNLSGAAYWHLRKQITPEQEIPEALYARNETEAMSHTLANGKANLAKYADPVVVRKSTKVPLKNRILPQSARVDKLRSEAIELEAAFKAGEFSAEEYTLLRDVAFKKLRRAEELLKKAITPVQKEEDSYEDEGVSSYASSDHPSDNNGHGEIYSSPMGVSFIDELSNGNMFKSFLKSACHITRKVIHFSQKARSYWNELKAV